MKRVPHVGAASPPIRLPGAAPVSREPTNQQGFVRLANVEMAAPCLRCPDAPCQDAGFRVANLCPVDVLSRADTPEGVLVGHGCVQCGVCVMRCPVGAISFTGTGAHVAVSANAVQGQPASAEEFLAWRPSVEQPTSMTPEQRRSLVSWLTANAETHRQGVYYRLVESLFNALGITARQSNHGDTSNRIDLILTDPTNPVPVEIKSHSEVTAINWKSVQQALENKIVMARLSNHADLDGMSSLVVGHAYPSARSGINGLIEDIDRAFGIRIGLVSLWRLYDLLVGVSMGEPRPSRETFSTLKGPL